MRRLRATHCMEGLYVCSGLDHTICRQNVLGGCGRSIAGVTELQSVTGLRHQNCKTA